MKAIKKGDMIIMKRAIGLALSLLLGIGIFPVEAAEVEDTFTTASMNSFVDFMSPLYEGSQGEYLFIDAEGNDITQTVLMDTRELGKDAEWEKIRKYVNENVAFMKYERITNSATLANGTKSITKTTTCGATVRGVSGSPSASNYTREVIWDISGTVYYNESTGLVTSYTSGSISNAHVIPVGMIKSQNITASKASNQRSVTYNSWVEAAEDSAYGDFYTIVYEKAYGNMTISVP
ncbi:hypothetical protein [Intestinimonas sp. MSJ-38]|uniref:hypothetical protein n=1 Tax=Intestinimonas sp. MSJ-38 TaxID=2841532 RepID=UPI001C12487B|nr:hypothetical protein [Intestinimonas sp. MSJ-38]MBU5432905.1 hypothetical protein [Intestinimonas sp. MSJ-38]